MTAPAAPTASRSSFFLVVLALVLAIPRIVRLAYPQVWIEDESYLNLAFMLSRGWMPYRDFPLPHFPVLEALLAAIFRAAPATIRTAEVVTAIAALAGSLGVFAIGRRIGGVLAGTVAAVIYATSGLLFRYHLFEREIFDVVPVLAAVWILCGGGHERAAADHADGAPAPLARSGALAAGALLAVAMTIKLTAFAGFAAIVVWLALERRRRDAWVVAATAIGVIAALSIGLAALFGTDFIVQVFVFRIVHASFPSLGVKLHEMQYTLDVALAAGLAGTAFVVWGGRTRTWRIVLLQLASGFVFLVLLNATYWAHTGIELLPWLALSGGALAEGLFSHPSPRAAAGRGESGRRRPQRARRDRRAPAWICAAGAVLLVLFVSPVRNLNWEAGDGSVYGFGYRSRFEIAQVAAFVRARTAANAAVATPPIIAFAANRREVVPYAELAGDIDELTQAVRRDGYLAAIRTSPLRSRGFWEGVAASRARTQPLIDRAITARSAGAVVNYSTDDLFPVLMVDVSQQALESAGYDIGLIKTDYEVWIPRQ